MNDLIIEDDTPMSHDLHPDDVVIAPTHEFADDSEEVQPNLDAAADVIAQFTRPDHPPVVILEDEAPASPEERPEVSMEDAEADAIAESGEPAAKAVAAPTHTAQTPDMPLPRIEVVPGKIGETLATVETLLADSGRFFQRNGKLVEIRADIDGRGCDVKAMTIESLQVALAAMSEWWRFNARSSAWKPCDPNAAVCRLLINGSSLSRLKPLKGVASQPHLRPDGSLCLSPGYDEATGIFGAFDARGITVKANPGTEEARAAVAELEDLLSEVAFATKQDLAAALSAILTAAVRPSLPHAPLFHVTAHQPGSGKTYLCDLIALFAGPKPPSQASFPGSNEECGKLLLSQLMRSPAVIQFDNLTTDIKPHDKLCSALTSDLIEGRVLGSSSTASVSTRALFLSSGNNVMPMADMGRRTMVIRLDPKVEMPSARTFARPNLLADVRSERTRYVTAALTVIRAWLASGATTVSCSPLGSFCDWSKWCRESLIWLGYEDPATGLFESLQSDPDRLLLGRVLQGWKSLYGASVVMLRSVVPAAMRFDPDDDFRDALVEASGGNDTINVRKLGHWLARREGHIVGGLRLVKAPKTGSAQNWCVVEVKT